MLPILLASGNKNYACEAANFFVQQSYTQCPRLSAQLVWSRFVNVHESTGKNIAGVLHMEHLNRIAKEAIRFQGTTKSKKAIEWIGQTNPPKLWHSHQCPHYVRSTAETGCPERHSDCSE